MFIKVRPRYLYCWCSYWVIECCKSGSLYISLYWGYACCDYIVVQKFYCTHVYMLLISNIANRVIQNQQLIINCEDYEKSEVLF